MLDKLKEYKELLTIVVFFLGGLFWIQNQFPTKTDLEAQIGELNCLLGKYMLLTQHQIRVRDLDRRQQELTQFISYADNPDPAGPEMSPAMLYELEGRKEDLASVRNEIREKASAINGISDELQRNVCGRT